MADKCHQCGACCRTLIVEATWLDVERERNAVWRNWPMILVVEDDPRIAEMVEEDLREAGLECRFVDNITEAQEVLADEKFACVILDRGLPLTPRCFSDRCGGDALLAWMRESGIVTPVVIHSANGSGVQELLRLGAQAFVPKPSPTGENGLVAVVRRIVEAPDA